MSLFDGPVPATTAPRASADGQQGGGYLVPASAGIGQILDYVSGSGGDWPFEIYSVGLPMSRDIAVTFATLNRAVTLISGAIGQLVATGGLYAVDRGGREAKSRRVMAVIERMGDSLDGGDSPALQTVEDMAADYCLDGNAISVPDWMRDGTLRRLTRMSAWASELIPTSDGGSVYRLQQAQGYGSRGRIRGSPRRRPPAVAAASAVRPQRVDARRLRARPCGGAPACARDRRAGRPLHPRSGSRRGAKSKLHIDYGVSSHRGPNTDHESPDAAQVAWRMRSASA